MGLGTLTDYFLLKSFVMILWKDAIYLEAASKNWILIFKAFIYRTGRKIHGEPSLKLCLLISLVNLG